MCASSGQNALAQEQLDAYKQAQDMTKEEYANQQAIYGPMAAKFKSIFDMGPNQQGFSDSERNALNAQAVEGTAQNYSQAAKAVGENLGFQGGGNDVVPSGGQIQLKEQVAQSAAENESNQETQIKEADYNQGYRQWLNAGSGLESIAAGDNPLGYENAATNAGSAAGTTEQQIADENNSWLNAAIGAAGTIGGAFAGCPAAGSLILMADGSELPVEELVAGDRVAGIDGVVQVVTRIEIGNSPIILVNVGDDLKLRCSPQHAFVRHGGGFTDAESSNQAEVVTRKKLATVTAVTADGEGQVYRLFLDGSHTYCVNDLWSVGD